MRQTQQEVWFYILRRFYWLDPKTGVLVRRKSGKAQGQINVDGYLKMDFQGKTVIAHRLVWLYDNAAWPEHTIDHRNTLTVDNRLCNLRDVPMASHTPKRCALADKPCLRRKRAFLSGMWERMRSEAEKNYQRKLKNKKVVERDLSATQGQLAFELIRDF